MAPPPSTSTPMHYFSPEHISESDHLIHYLFVNLTPPQGQELHKGFHFTASCPIPETVPSMGLIIICLINRYKTDSPFVLAYP